MGTAAILVLVGTLVAPSAQPTDPVQFSPGIGYTVAQIMRQLDRPAPTPEVPPTTTRLVPRLPPPASDLARIQGSPRARGLNAAAAIAAQVAMIVAGVISVREQREQIRREREGQAPPYRPYR